MRRRGGWLLRAGCEVPSVCASLGAASKQPVPRGVAPSHAQQCHVKLKTPYTALLRRKCLYELKDKSTISEEDLSVPTRMTLVESDIVFPLKIGLAARGRCWHHAGRYPHTVCHQGAASGTTEGKRRPAAQCRLTPARPPRTDPHLSSDT